jgi:hypothetical protein
VRGPVRNQVKMKILWIHGCDSHATRLRRMQFTCSFFRCLWKKKSKVLSSAVMVIFFWVVMFVVHNANGTGWLKPRESIPNFLASPPYTHRGKCPQQVAVQTAACFYSNGNTGTCVYF